MLYPKEDKLNNVLVFACRMCPYAEQAEAEATCIYRNALKEEIAETAGNVEDVAQDPTVGDSSDYESAPYVYGSGYDSVMDVDVDREEAVPEMCTLCGKEILCPYCGQPSANGILLETADPDVVKDSQEEQEQVELEQRERALSGAGMRLP